MPLRAVYHALRTAGRAGHLPPMSNPDSDRKRLERERDLYRDLLELSGAAEPERYLARALGVIADATGASQAYVQLSDDPDAEAPTFWCAHDCTGQELSTIRSRISCGVIQEAIATGTTVLSSSALLDERFSGRASVRAHQIEAVICVPVAGEPSLGVIYLQGRDFQEEDRTLAEACGRFLSSQVDSLLLRARMREEVDPTRKARQRLRSADALIGTSPALAATLQACAGATAVPVNVLLLGESGTGKSQLARLIHASSARADGPFKEQNCAAIPEQLVESIFFGHVRGSFTGAVQDQEGIVHAARGGTLFLDEVEVLSPRAQAILLQFLESGVHRRVGSTRDENSDARLIAATNADIEEAVKDGRFREDLFHRLQVIRIRVPSLRERRDDIPALARHFCDRFSRRFGLPPFECSPAAVRGLMAEDWPGNVRELDHRIQAAATRALGEHQRLIERRHLHAEEATTAPARPNTMVEHLRDAERRALEDKLRETDWNVAQAARDLDIARSQAYKLIDRYGLKRRDPE